MHKRILHGPNTAELLRCWWMSATKDIYGNSPAVSFQTNDNEILAVQIFDLEREDTYGDSASFKGVLLDTEIKVKGLYYLGQEPHKKDRGYIESIPKGLVIRLEGSDYDGGIVVSGEERD